MTTTADKLRGLMEGATRGPWKLHNDTFNCTIQVGEAFFGAPYQPPHGRGECPQQRADGRLIVAAVNLLTALAAVVEAMEQIATEESGGYGYYLGGDPRKFSPDPESCTPKELEDHKAACDKWNEAEAKGEKLEPEPCGCGWVSPTVHVSRSSYGLGSYSFPTDAARMAQKALSALDEAVRREVQDA